MEYGTCTPTHGCDCAEIHVWEQGCHEPSSHQALKVLILRHSARTQDHLICRSGLDVRANRERCIGVHNLDDGYQHKATTYNLSYGPNALKSSLSSRFKSMDRSGLSGLRSMERSKSVTSAMFSQDPRPGLQPGQRDPGATGTQRTSRPQTTIGSMSNMRQTEHTSAYANWGFQERGSGVSNHCSVL